MSLYYIQADGDKFIRHIYDLEPTRWDDDNFCRVAKLTPEQRKKFGVYPLKLVTPPPFDPNLQIRENGPALLINGQWVQNWLISELEPEMAVRSAEAQWNFVRSRRNDFLTATDWWVTKAAETGVELAADKQAYRQALRDITEQADPFNIIWPTEPGA